jgi:hypothetical protein
MRAHVFVVNENTYPVHRDRHFCGIGHSQDQYETYEALKEKMLTSGGTGCRGMLADILGTRPGDLVFLYENGVGFHGVYEIAGTPFFDNTVVQGIEQYAENTVEPNICFRVPIKCKYYFAEPVPEDMLFATPERETLFWVWFYRKIQIRGARGCTAMDPDASRTLVDLLIRINGTADDPPTSKQYPATHRAKLTVPLGEESFAAYEDLLRAWLVRNIDNSEQPDVRGIFGPESDLEWFANNVPYHVAGRNIDILAFHSSDRYSKEPTRYRYSVMELKRNRASLEDIEQLIGYSSWVTSRLAGGEGEMVRPVLVANGFRKEAVAKAYHSDWEIRLIHYEVVEQDIVLQQIQETE